MKSHEITTCKNKWTAAFVFYPCHAEQAKLWRPFSQRESNLPNHLFVSRRYKPYDWCNWQSNGVYLLRPHDFQDLSLLDYVHLWFLWSSMYCMYPLPFNTSVSTCQRAKSCQSAPCTAMPCPSHLDGVKSTRLDQGEGRPCDTETRQTIIRVSSEGEAQIEKNKKTTEKTMIEKEQIKTAKTMHFLNMSRSPTCKWLMIGPLFEASQTTRPTAAISYSLMMFHVHDVSCSSASSKASS